VLTSDIHGNLFDPELVEAGEVMLISGDICPDYQFARSASAQREWIRSEFIPWARRVPVDLMLVDWGNHDWYGEHVYHRQGAGIGVDPEIAALLPPNVKFLTDASYYLPNDMKVYLTPWQPEFCGWAFNALDTASDLGSKFLNIPEDTEILVVHGPPYGYGDRTYGADGRRVGSQQLRMRIDSLPKLRLVVCGHIHEGYGSYQHMAPNGRTVDIVNASRCDRLRMPCNPLVYWKP
jgi:hypothetical protein